MAAENRRVVRKFEDGSIRYSDGTSSGGTVKYKGYSVRKRGSWDFSGNQHAKIRKLIFKKYGKQPWETR